MMTPNELAELAREGDEYAEQFPGGISVELAPGQWLGFLADGRISLNAQPFALTPAKVRALLHGLRMLDAVSDLESAKTWRPDPDAWKRGGAE